MERKERKRDEKLGQGIPEEGEVCAPLQQAGLNLGRGVNFGLFPCLLDQLD